MRSMTGEGERGWTALIRLPPATTFSRLREKEEAHFAGSFTAGTDSNSTFHNSPFTRFTSRI